MAGESPSAGSTEMLLARWRVFCGLGRGRRDPAAAAFKLDGQFQLDDWFQAIDVKPFLASRRTGSYFAVAREGEVGAGDELKPIAGAHSGVPRTCAFRVLGWRFSPVLRGSLPCF